MSTTLNTSPPELLEGRVVRGELGIPLEKLKEAMIQEEKGKTTPFVIAGILIIIVIVFLTKK